MYLLVLLCVGVGFIPSLVFIDQLRFLDDLPDAAEAASLLLDLRFCPVFRLAAHVVVGIHLRFRPEEKDLLQLQRFLVVPQAVPLVLCRPAKASEVVAAEGHVLLEGDLDADQLLLGVGFLNVLKVGFSLFVMVCILRMFCFP